VWSEEKPASVWDRNSTTTSLFVNLRRRVFHRAFSRLRFAGPITVAVARLLVLAAFVALAAKDIANLALN
jgi:hypothetical protein